MKTFNIILPMLCLSLVLMAGCDSGKKQMLVPPSEAPEPMLVPPAVADATADSHILVASEPGPLDADRATDVTIEGDEVESSEPVFFHVCRNGDSLLSVSKEHGVDLNALANINNLTRNLPLSADRVLLLPRNLGNLTAAKDVTTYTVVRGDTYSRIARHYRLSSKALMHLNKAEDSKLDIGDVLYVPNAR